MIDLNLLLPQVSDDKIRAFIIAFILIQYVWELYLGRRQHLLCKRTTKVPPELTDVLTQDTFEQSRLYFFAKSQFSIYKELFSTVLVIFVILSGSLGVIWKWSYQIYPFENEIPHSLTWLFLLQLFSTIISLPFSIYYTFVLEEKFGFNKQTALFFATDNLKSFIVTQVILLPVAAGIIAIVKNGGTYFFVWLWLFVCIVLIAGLTIYPSVIAPLFDKFTPLPEGELRQAIENLASQLKFPLKQLYVVEGSKRSAHSNAYIFGLFGGKRIVLFDTLIGSDDKPGCSTEQILAVLGHELGHWKFGHLKKNLIITQVNLLLMFLAFSSLFRYAPLYTTLGFEVGVQPVMVGLVAVFTFVLAPYSAFLNFVMTLLSRRFEFQADAFAKDLGMADPLKGALIQLTKDNLGFPIYDDWYSKWHHSHPPLLQRIAQLEPNKKSK